jgi:hypothetical protein
MVFVLISAALSSSLVHFVVVAVVLFSFGDLHFDLVLGLTQPKIGTESYTRKSRLTSVATYFVPYKWLYCRGRNFKHLRKTLTVPVNLGKPIRSK